VSSSASGTAPRTGERRRVARRRVAVNEELPLKVAYEVLLRAAMQGAP
jgi:hypothetical protein